MRYHCLPGREDYPWEAARILADEPPEKIRDDLALALKTEIGSRSKREHAYTATQLKQVRSLLKLGEIADECLHRHLDEFAIYVGLQIRFEPTSSPKDCIANIQQTLVSPLESLALNLEGYGLRSEFMVQWGALRDFDLIKFEADIQTLLALAARQVERHEKRSVKGRDTYSSIKAHHVQMVDDLAAYLQPDFYPTRRKTFATLVSLLAEPLFAPDMSFTGVIREHIDDWRRKLEQLRGEASRRREC